MSLLHPAQTDRRPHTRDAGRHTKSTTQRPGGTSHDTPAGLGAHARAPPPPRSHQRHRGGELGGDDASPSSSFPHARQQANARHHSRPGRFHTRKGSRNPQPPRHGGPAQGEAKHSRVTATRVGKRMRKRAKETGARAARQAEEGAGKGRRGRTRATHATTVRAEGPHHAAGRPASRARAHNPHHHTRDLTAGTLRRQGRSRGDGKAVPDAANRGPSCLSHSHPNTHLHAGKTTGPAPATSHGQTPTPQGPHGHAGSGALKEPTLPRRGEGERPSPQRQRGGVGAAPGPRRARHRRHEGEDAGSALGHKSRTRRGNGHGIPPPHTRAVPRRLGHRSPPLATLHVFSHAHPRAPPPGRLHATSPTTAHTGRPSRHLPPIQPSGSPCPEKHRDPEGTLPPGATTRAEGEERAGPSPTHVPTAARQRPVAARGGEQGKLRAAHSRHSPRDAQDGPRAPPPSPGRQGNTRRVTREARAHTGTRAGPQHEERATDRQPGPAGPSPDTEGGGAGRGH